jgi:hypothetical protein
MVGLFSWPLNQHSQGPRYNWCTVGYISPLNRPNVFTRVVTSCNAGLPFALLLFFLYLTRIKRFWDSQSCPKLDTDLLTRVRTEAIFSLVIAKSAITFPPKDLNILKIWKVWTFCQWFSSLCLVKAAADRVKCGMQKDLLSKSEGHSTSCQSGNEDHKPNDLIACTIRRRTYSSCRGDIFLPSVSTIGDNFCTHTCTRKWIRSFFWGSHCI